MRRYKRSIEDAVRRAMYRVGTVLPTDVEYIYVCTVYVHIVRVCLGLHNNYNIPIYQSQQI